jgi:hypothetical protein
VKTNNTATYLYEVMKDKEWNNHPCFIVGGGNSLEGFDFDILQGLGKIIAVNQSLLNLPFANMFASMDSRYFRWIHEGVLGGETLVAYQDFKGIKVWVNTEMDKTDWKHEVFILDHTGDKVVCQHMEDGVWTGGNSGFSALQIAAVLGCNPIYLLGFDFKQVGGSVHHHKEYPEPTDPQAMTRVHPPSFYKLAPQLNKVGIKVININQPDTTELRCFSYGKIVLREPIYVSYYTPAYKGYADNLGASLRQFGLKYEIRAINGFGKWEKNCHYKPVFLKEMMEKYNQPVVWVDADAEIQSYPFLFDNTTADIAVHYKGGHELLSGTIFLNNTPKAKELVDIWVKAAKDKPLELDQVTLKYATNCWDGKIKRLPARYTNIHDLMNVPNPIITHNQASRRYRKYND